MAYTIISQNNTTTTLADENGNVITVPARVTLATSTDYTITKVNNNSVDLEDGDGKIIRGVPACVVLAGEGGGGGSVDTSKVINADVLPTADASSAGKYYLYTGATTAEYTQNYIYKNVKTATYTGEIFFAFSEELSVDCSTSDFANFIASEGGVDPTLVTRGGMTYKGDNLWELVARNSDGDELCTIREYTEDFQDAGFTFSGTPTVDDTLTFDCTITEVSATYAWTRVDVQPAGSSLPDQTGQSGKFLTTDGTDASWSDVTQTKNCYNEGAFQIGGNNDASLLITKNTTSTSSYTGGSFAGDNTYGGLDLRAGSGAAYTHRSYIFNKTSFSTNPIQGTHLCDLGKSDSAWKTVYAQKLNNGADIAIPTTGGTMAVIGVNTTATLAVADWSSSTQTVTVSGVTATSVVFVSPAPASASDYASAGILCTAQAADSLTFTCTTTPTSAITVNVVCM